MAYKALYRTYRPGRFSDVVGQEHIIPVLRRQCATGRLSHAYLFSGPRGTGKTSTALVFARAINCFSPEEGEPCGKCESCTAVSHIDIIEIDAASNNGVDEIRDLREKARFAPAIGKYKVYIIDEVHMLSTGAFNALLKTLEEPPSHVIFILATTEPHKLPATIISRCQRFNFHRIAMPVIVERLRFVAEKAGAKADDAALRQIAAAAEGGLRDALGILEQCIAFSKGTIHSDDVAVLLGGATFEENTAVAKAIVEGDAPGALDAFSGALNNGRDMMMFLRGIASYLRDMMLWTVTGDAPALFALEGEQRKTLGDLAAKAGLQRILRCLELLNRAENDMKFAAQPAIVLEASLVRACMPREEQDMAAILDRLEMLEKKLEQGDFPKRQVELSATPKIAGQENRTAAHAAALQEPEKAPRIREDEGKDGKNETVDAPLAEEQAGQPLPEEGGGKGAGKPGTEILKETLSILTRENLSVYTIASQAKNMRLEGERAVLVFPVAGKVFADSLAQEVNMRVFKEALSQAAGRELEVVCRAEDAQEEKESLFQRAANLLGQERVKRL
jgi:DNA polymerase-3 subunit gamma/tau